MIIYEGTKRDFLNSVKNDIIANEIQAVLREKMNKNVSPREYISWENSLKSMYMVLDDEKIPMDSGVAIEYNIPQTSKRVDFLISGYDQKEKSNVIIVELKQWSEIEEVEGRDALVETYIGKGKRRVVHPSYQAWSYASLIKDYNKAVQEKDIGIFPCAYLHNYLRREKDPIDSEIYKEYLSEAPVFSKTQATKLSEYIKSKITFGDSNKTIKLIENGKIRPSKSLQNSILKMLKENDEFVMIDEQKVIYEEIKALSIKAVKKKSKKVIIVEGGPGTGKTVVAINLLAKLTAQNQYCQYSSKNSAPRYVYQSKLKGEMKKSTIDNLFKGTGNYTQTETNFYDTILVDEAHRLNAKSGMFQNLGENQIKEIINSAKCSVFFIDESQKVTMKDIGTVDEIEKWANKLDAKIYKYELASQFRCNGSNGYLAWLDDVLEIRKTANYDFDSSEYDFKIVDTPLELKNLIYEKNKQANKSRLAAGYCWNWISSGKNDSNVYDIVIDDFKMSWNLGNSSTFAIDETSVNEVGCIHTTQGLEFDYVGIIIGNDLRYANGKIITDFVERAKTDTSLKGIKKLNKQDPEEAAKIADEIIKNTYRTLMTRGMKGCYVYCTDKELNNYLKQRTQMKYEY